MSRAGRFIYSSDFATLQNDDVESASVVMPGSQSISSASLYSNFTDVEVGSAEAEARVRIQSSKLGDKQYAGWLGVNRTGTVSGSPAFYTIYAVAIRTSPTNMRCYIVIGNPYGATLNCASGDETFTFYINTFIPPAGV